MEPRPISLRSAKQPALPDPQVEQVESPATGDVYSSQVDQNQVIPSLNRAFSYSLEVDPNWDLEPERMETDLAQSGLQDMPTEWVSELAAQTNEQDYTRKLGHLQERLQANQELDQLGGAKGVAVMLGSYLTDPAAIAVDLALGGTTKGRALYRVMQGGGRATVAHAAIEGMLSLEGDVPPPGQIAAGFAASFMLGGAAGGVFGKADTDPLAQTIRQMVNDEAGGRPRFTPVDDSVGAARNPLVPDAIPNTDMTASDMIRWSLYDKYGEAAERTTAQAARFDAAASGMRGTNDLTRSILRRAVHDPFNKDGALSWMETSDRIRGQLDQRFAPRFTEGYLEYQKQGVGKGRIRSMYTPGAASDREAFGKMVGQYIFSEGAMDAPPGVAKAAQAFSDMMDEALDIARQSGVKGANLADKSKWYMPRVVDRNAINRLASVRGRDVVLEDLIHDSLTRFAKRNASDAAEITDEMSNVLRSTAKAYVRWMVRHAGKDVEDLEDLDVDLSRMSKTDELRTFLNDNLEGDERSRALDMLQGLDGDVSDQLDAVTGVNKSANPEEMADRMKFRLGLDHGAEVTTPDGQRIRMADIYEMDAEKLAFEYQRWVGGESALAGDGLSSAAFRRATEETRLAHANSKGNPDLKGAPTEKDVDMMDFMYRSTMGLRMDDVGETARRTMALARNASYVSRMGMAWIHSFSESMSIAAMAGPGRFIKNLPALKQITRAVRGKEAEGLVSDLQRYTGGTGASLVRNMGQLRYELDVTSGSSGILRAAEDTMEGIKRAATEANMLAHSTDMMRQFDAMLAMDQIDDILVRGGKEPKWFSKRAETWTLTPERREVLKEHLKRNAVRDKAGKIERLKKGTPEEELAMQEYLYRHTSEAIMHLNAGNLPKFMQHPLAKMLFQFRSWEMGSWARHTLKDLHMRDRVAATKFVASSMMASLAYVGRSYWTSGGDRDKLERALDPDRIAFSGIGYSVNVGIMPTVVDSITSMALGGPVFKPVRTTGLASGLGVDPDSWAFTQLGEDYAKIVQIPLRQARHLFQEREFDSLSREEGRALFAGVFLDTMWFTRPGKEWVLNQMEPESEKTDTNTSLQEILGLTDE